MEIDTHDFQPGFTSLKYENGTLFKHFKYRELFRKRGPSRQVQESDSYIQSFLNMPKGFFLDHVWAVFCPVWPSVAGEWKTRIRVNGWPPRKRVNEIVNAGCHLVGKSHQPLVENDYEWRFSFSKAELLLVTSWNPNQLYIYHLIRLVKNRVIQACGGSDKTTLSTYHFKTLMLWACEKKSQEFWNEENIVSSVEELIIEMIEILIEKCCPNYFIRENNMFVVPDGEDFQREIDALLECATVQSISQEMKKIPRACLDCRVNLLDVKLGTHSFVIQLLSLRR